MHNFSNEIIDFFEDVKLIIFSLYFGGRRVWQVRFHNIRLTRKL